MWDLDDKKPECWRIDAFVLWCWRRLLRVPWTARRSNLSILKEISPEYSLEGLRLKWNTLAISYEELTCLKRPWCWEDWRQEEKGTKEDEMVGWHYQLSGHEIEQIPGDGEGQGSLACCSPRGPRVRHDLATEQQKNIHNVNFTTFTSLAHTLGALI